MGTKPPFCYMDRKCRISLSGALWRPLPAEQRLDGLYDHPHAWLYDHPHAWLFNHPHAWLFSQVLQLTHSAPQLAGKVAPQPRKRWATHTTLSEQRGYFIRRRAPCSWDVIGDPLVSGLRSQSSLTDKFPRSWRRPGCVGRLGHPILLGFVTPIFLTFKHCHGLKCCLWFQGMNPIPAF